MGHDPVPCHQADHQHQRGDGPQPHAQFGVIRDQVDTRCRSGDRPGHPAAEPQEHLRPGSRDAMASRPARTCPSRQDEQRQAEGQDERLTGHQRTARAVDPEMPEREATAAT